MPSDDLAVDELSSLPSLSPEDEKAIRELSIRKRRPPRNANPIGDGPLNARKTDFNLAAPGDAALPSPRAAVPVPHHVGDEEIAGPPLGSEFCQCDDATDEHRQQYVAVLQIVFVKYTITITTLLSSLPDAWSSNR